MPQLKPNPNRKHIQVADLDCKATKLLEDYLANPTRENNLKLCFLTTKEVSKLNRDQRKQLKEIINSHNQEIEKVKAYE